MNTRLFQKDFITTPDWTVEDLNTMIDLAFKLKGDFATGVLHDHILRAKTLYMLFFEESTRTRNSFETGMTQLGGHAIWLTPKATQIGHGENAKDTGMVLSSYGNGISIRDCRTGIGNKYLYEMAQYADAPILNMQDDMDHPCQAMANLFTLMELFGRDLRGRKFVVSWTYAPKYVRPLSVPQSLVWLMPAVRHGRHPGLSEGLSPDAGSHGQGPPVRRMRPAPPSPRPTIWTKRSRTPTSSTPSPGARSWSPRMRLR